MRLRLDVSYDGTGFSGWAAQPGQRTVQGDLEAALATILGTPSARLTVAGRTDAGVHARGQVCHVDLEVTALEGAGLEPASLDPEQVCRRLRRLLPADIVVRRVTEAPAGFDARFSAIWRRYAYRVSDRPDLFDPLMRLQVLRWPRPLDEVAMNAAADGLLGEHDFAAFCKRREGASTVRRLTELTWSRGAGLLTCRVVADSFCHNMVRALVGCLLVVGEGKRPPGWAAEVLGARVRDPRVPVVAPHGLTLEEVGYP